MDCPRCGGSLTHYQLADAETVACDDCTYVGVPVDHTSEHTHRESWTEALDRFYREHSVEEVEEIVTHEGVPLSAAVMPVFESADDAATDDGNEPADDETDTDESGTDTEKASAETQRADTQN